MDYAGCILDMPYPPIEVDGKNPYYAQLLMLDYAGRIGEMTSMAQYYYQYLITENEYENIATKLECVAAAELFHLNILGKLIVLLGGDPVFKAPTDVRSNFWCSDNASYSRDISDFLLENIKLERQVIEVYNRHTILINDSKVRAILQRIILDEEEHIRIFYELLLEYQNQQNA